MNIKKSSGNLLVVGGIPRFFDTMEESWVLGWGGFRGCCGGPIDIFRRFIHDYPFVVGFPSQVTYLRITEEW